MYRQLLVKWQLSDGLENVSKFYRYSNARRFITIMQNEYDEFVLMEIIEKRIKVI